ncbi:uncharacterized protein [Prorops nasuta]|uniref:uncharacterized protein n=1 Tax=Prorops nasuta TaxID=863751 RepID=UPI0034CD878E
MKAALSLTILSTLLLSQLVAADYTKTLKHQAERYAKDVAEDVRDLQAFLNNAKDSADKDHLEDNIKRVLENSLENVRHAVDNAKHNGKDAEHCYDNAKKALEKIYNEAQENINKCNEDHHAQLRSVYKDVEELLAFGKKIISTLDNIVENCHFTGKVRQQSCMMDKLRTANKDMMNLHGKTGMAIKRAESALGNVSRTLSQCYSKIETTVRREAEVVKREGLNCAQE